MKRMILFVLVLALALSLVACGTTQKEDTGGGKISDAGEVSDPVEDNSQETTYQQAQQLLLEKKYDEAAELFESLEDYRNSREMAQECKYLKAAQLIQAKNYEGARAVLTGIREYKDAKTLLTKFVWKYEKAVKTTEAGADLTLIYTYTYDENGYAVASSYESSSLSNSYTYVNELDEQGRIKRITSTSVLGYLTVQNYIYNDKGQLSCLSSTYNDSYVQDIYYTYNELGQVIRETTPDTESVTDYTYDEQGNILTADGNFGGSTYVNTYDENGRLVKYVRTDGSYSTTFELTYDENGNVVKETSLGEDGFLNVWEYSGYKLFYQP